MDLFLFSNEIRAHTKKSTSDLELLKKKCLNNDSCSLMKSKRGTNSAGIHTVLLNSQIASTFTSVVNLFQSHEAGQAEMFSHLTHMAGGTRDTGDSGCLCGVVCPTACRVLPGVTLCPPRRSGIPDFTKDCPLPMLKSLFWISPGLCKQILAGYFLVAHVYQVTLCMMGLVVSWVPPTEAGRVIWVEVHLLIQREV